MSIKFRDTVRVVDVDFKEEEEEEEEEEENWVDPVLNSPIKYELLTAHKGRLNKYGFSLALSSFLIEAFCPLESTCWEFHVGGYVGQEALKLARKCQSVVSDGQAKDFLDIFFEKVLEVAPRGPIGSAKNKASSSKSELPADLAAEREQMRKQMEHIKMNIDKQQVNYVADIVPILPITFGNPTEGDVENANEEEKILDDTVDSGGSSQVSIKSNEVSTIVQTLSDVADTSGRPKTAESKLIIADVEQEPERPKPVSSKILVFDLNGVLPKAQFDLSWYAQKPFETRTKWVYPRPYLKEMLDQAFTLFRCAIWSSMENRNIQEVLRVVPELHRDWASVWDQSKCKSLFNPKDPTGKKIFVKCLSDMMDDLGVQEKEDIIIVDDDALKCCFNQSQSLNPPSYHPEDFDKDDFLLRFVSVLHEIPTGKTVEEIQTLYPHLDRTGEIDRDLEKIVLERELF